MSKFNHYAKKLEAAFLEARSEFTEAYTELQQAEQDRKKAGEWFAEKYEGERAARQAKSEFYFIQAKARFAEVNNRVWVELNRQRDELRAALQKEVQEDGTASPDAIDTNALELLKSDILTPDDYLAFVNKYDGNPTMLRLIAKFAKDAADDMTDDRAGQAALLRVAHECESGQGRVMRAWDDLARVMDYCTGQARGRREDSAFIVAMSRRWEELAAEAVTVF